VRLWEEAEEEWEVEEWRRVETGEEWRRIETGDDNFNGPMCNNDALVGASMSGDLCAMGGEALAYMQPMICPVAIPMMVGTPDQCGMNGVVIAPPEWGEARVVTMDNVPGKYTQSMLLQELENTGFQGTFNSVHLPIDPATGNHQGYAVVDFVSSGHAWMFKMAYEGRKMIHFSGETAISVTPVYDNNMQHRNKARANHGVDEGERSKAPKARRRRGGGSLIDLAKQRMALAQRVAAEGNDGAAAQLWQGVPMPQPAPAAAAPSPTGSAGSKESSSPNFCPFCGGKTQASFKFCSFCGANLAALQKAAE